MAKQIARRQGAEARRRTSNKMISLCFSSSSAKSIALVAVAALLLFSASLAMAASPDATSPTTRDAEFNIEVEKAGAAAAEAKTPSPAAGDEIAASGAAAPSPAPAAPSPKSSPAAAAAAPSSSTSSSSSSKEAKPAAPVPLVREPSKWKATGPPFAGSAYSFFAADGKKQPVLAYQEASKGAVGAGSAPGGATRLYRLENGGSWVAAAAPLPAPSMTATADAVDDGASSKPDLKTIDPTRAVDYFLNGVAVSPQSGLVFVVFFPFATTDAAVEKAKAATPLVYATAATGEDAGWVLVGAPSSSSESSSNATTAAAAVPVGLGRAGPWRGAAVAADGDEVFVAYTANGGGSNGTLTVSKATVKKNAAAAASAPDAASASSSSSSSSPLLTTTTWTRVGSKPLEVAKTSPGRAFVGANGGHLVAGFENGDPFPGIAFERWSKKIGDKKFDEGKWERACGGNNANGTVPDSGNSQYDAPFLVASDGSAFLGTSPGTATNAVAAAAAALLTSTGFDELDKLGKLPNQVFVCKPGAKSWREVFSGANGATAEGVEGRQSLTALALGPKDSVFAAYEGQAGPFVSKSGSNARDGSSKPTTVGGQGLGGRVLGRPVGLVVDANGVPTIALTNRGFGNTTGDSEDFREIVVKTCKAC